MAGSVLLAFATAELGARLLAPRQKTIEPAAVDLRSHFSASEIERGARFARPQMALGLGRAAVQLGALALAVRRPPQLARRFISPVAGGAATAAGLAVSLSLPGLPLAAIARRRARAGRGRYSEDRLS